MALDATTVWEVRPAGSGSSDTNGGGYSSGGTDYSQQDSPELSVSDAACSGDTTVTSATGGFTAAMVGNVMYLSSGPGWYKIAGHTDTNTVTIDRNGPNASGMTANVGGALATPGGLGAVLAAHGVAGMKTWIKSGTTYTLSGATANQSGGPLSLAEGLTHTIEGYGSSRGDLGTRPTISAGSQTNLIVFNLLNTGNTTPQVVVNVKIDGNSQTGVKAFSSPSANRNFIYRCQAFNCSDTAAYGFQNLNSIACYSESCYWGFRYANATYCEAYNSSAIGFNDAVTVCCIARTCGVGFMLPANGVTVNCIADGCTDDGFRVQYANTPIVNSVATENTGEGFEDSAKLTWLIRCAGFQNSGGNYDSTYTVFNEDFRALTGDPWLGASDYRPDNTSGEGEELRATGIGVDSQTTNRDRGAVQHSDPAGGTTVNTTINLVYS